MNKGKSSVSKLDGETWLRLLRETQGVLRMSGLPKAEAEDLASDLLVEAQAKETPEAWLRAVTRLRANDVLRGAQHDSLPEHCAPTASASETEGKRRARRLSQAQRNVLRGWLDVVAGGLEELWSFYAGFGDAAPVQVAQELRRRHERILSGRSGCVDLVELRRVTLRYEIPANFDELIADEVRRTLNTGKDGWVESDDHQPTARRGRPAAEAHRSVPTIWRKRRDAAMSRVAFAAARLVSGISAALINDLEKDAAAARRVENKRLAKLYVALRDGQPIPKRGRPKKKIR